MGKQAEKRARIWEVQTQLYDTYGAPLIDMDKMRVRLDALHQSGELLQYAYVVHNRCRYTQEDEDRAAAEIARGSKRKPVKAGDPKPEHVHIELQLKNAKTLTALAAWLSCPEITVPVQWVVYVRENEAGETQTFEDKCAYLCHERQPEKEPYRYDEIVATFDYEAMLKKYMAAKARKARGKASRAFQEEHVNKIAAGEISIAEFIRQIKNPYCFKCGKFTVRAQFADNGVSLEDCLKQILI